MSEEQKPYPIRKHEDCPEVTENEVLIAAAAIHLEYQCKINALIQNYTYSQCRKLLEVCDLAKGNNCSAHLYYAVVDLREALTDLIQWHKFNRSVHGIDLT